MRFLISVLLILFVVSCSDDPTRTKTKNIIKKDRFVEILIDIHLMDAITNSPGYFRKYNPQDSLLLYDNIFEKHQVTKAMFDSTISAYTRQPEEYKAVYDEVLLRLNRRLDELKDSQAEKAKEEDPYKDLRVNPNDE